MASKTYKVMGEYSLGRATVLGQVASELQTQDTKWGEQNHSPEWWLAIIGEEFGEACQAALDKLLDESRKPRYLKQYRSELLQVAASAVAAIEALDRNNDNLQR